ncbi:MAG: lipoprotein insertase outer membrane protein LolB [Thiotrichaceae bacterium]|uniref:Outer-membrane lipoprotein LolB n=1 Tax=Candidatus Thiocaldithrix dubininis TaxID=3080823 RepID=A0AA95KJH8_9GAMM|nr:MAG: lipoprotein insertase outer membrane protein LolB [Candidatus Thiocaldithrix dubininis]
MYQRIVVALCAATLVGCASAPKPQQPTTPNAPQTKPSSPEQAWQQRQATFARMAAWQLQGKVGIQFRDQSATFGITWAQRGADQYEMNIKHPLTGAVVALLNGSAGRVSLTTNGKTTQDASAEHLLKSQVGVSLPVEGMKYWVRGVAAPGMPIQQVKLDYYGRPEVLQQAGWVIEYPEWEGNGTNALPEKIQLKRAAENTRVKVVAQNWQTK